jgi:pimeloyl-ACP methyl ester carboxylesterase
VDTRRIDVGGVTLVVDEDGAGGRPLLLVHGFTGCRDDFTPIAAALVAAGWHVAAPDHRGHGDSDQPPQEDDYGVERFAGDMVGLVDALGWERFVIFGHSMGGMVAQHLAVTVPGRVAALVLMDTAPGALPVDPAGMAQAAAVARGHGMAELVDRMNRHGDPVGYGPAWERAARTVPGYRERGTRNTLRCSPAMFARMMEAFGTMPDRSDDLAGVRCPTLVVVGEEDALMLAPSRRLAEVVPGARLAVVPDAGHAPQFENTPALLDVVMPFLAEQAPLF